ncbi:MAG: DUF1194 domain-containing protein [Paracoccaceae bacterium]
MKKNVLRHLPFPRKTARAGSQARKGIVARLAFPAMLVAAQMWMSADKAVADGCADVDLVLAIDASGSIDPAEFALQQRGYSSAFRSADVQHALLSAGIVDVAVVLWGDSEMSSQVLPWFRIADPQSADVFAARLDGLFRKVTGNTGIGNGLSTALDLLEMPGQCGWRKIVNVSGDGRESFVARPRYPIRLSEARDRATDLGVVVNALAIENEVLDLADWYTGQLITGPGAFVMQVDGFDAFAEGIALKLVREVGPPNLAMNAVGPRWPDVPPKVDTQNPKRGG